MMTASMDISSNIWLRKRSGPLYDKYSLLTWQHNLNLIQTIFNRGWRTGFFQRLGVRGELKENSINRESSHLIQHRRHTTIKLDLRILRFRFGLTIPTLCLIALYVFSDISSCDYAYQTHGKVIPGLVLLTFWSGSVSHRFSKDRQT